jgi:hypothetical protein
MAFSALVADKYAPANTHAGTGVYLGPDVCNNSGSLAMFAADPPRCDVRNLVAIRGKADLTLTSNFVSF